MPDENIKYENCRSSKAMAVFLCHRKLLHVICSNGIKMPSGRIALHRRVLPSDTSLYKIKGIYRKYSHKPDIISETEKKVTKMKEGEYQNEKNETVVLGVAAAVFMLAALHLR
ncbi:MAG: hypothetical protein ACLUTA_05775 [Blautia wexlerae]